MEPVEVQCFRNSRAHRVEADRCGLCGNDVNMKANGPRKKSQQRSFHPKAQELRAGASAPE